MSTLEEGRGCYLPLRLGVSPKKKQNETDMRSEQTTVTTALNASPHFDFTISILPKIKVETLKLNKYPRVIIEL